MTFLDLAVTDAHSHIDAALRDERKVVLPEGRFVISKTLKAAFRGCQLIGQGAGRTILDFSSIAPGTSAFEFTGTKETGGMISVEGLSIIGPTASGFDPHQNGILVRGDDPASSPSGFRFRDLEICNMGWAAIFLENCHDVMAVDFHLHDCGLYGFNTEGADTVLFERGRIHTMRGDGDGTAYGGAFSRGGDMLALNPPSRNCTARGLHVYDIPMWEGLDTHGADHVLLEGNRIWGVKYGISIVHGDGSSGQYAGEDVLVRGNTIHSPAPGAINGVLINGNSVSRPTDIRIEGNRLVGFGTQGDPAIEAVYAGRVRIADNIIVGSNWCAIYLNDPIDEAIVRDNEIMEVAPAGGAAIGVLVDPGVKGLALNNFFRQDGATMMQRFSPATPIADFLVGTNHARGNVS